MIVLLVLQDWRCRPKACCCRGKHRLRVTASHSYFSGTISYTVTTSNSGAGSQYYCQPDPTRPAGSTAIRVCCLHPRAVFAPDPCTVTSAAREWALRRVFEPFFAQVKPSGQAAAN